MIRTLVQEQISSKNKRKQYVTETAGKRAPRI